LYPIQVEGDSEFGAGAGSCFQCAAQLASQYVHEAKTE